MNMVFINENGFPTLPFDGHHMQSIQAPSDDTLWYLPKWDGSSWIETATDEQKQEIDLQNGVA